MATFDRTTIVRGPCKITYDGATFYSKGGVTLTVNQSSFDKQSDAYGLIGRGKTDMSVVVEFEPVGEIESLTVLFPYGATTIGTGIYGATDKNLVIVATDATYTVFNAAVTQMPSIRCTATNTAFGSVQFTGLVATSGEAGDMGEYLGVGAGASIGVAFSPSLVVAGPYTGNLNGDGPFATESGFDVSFDLSLTPIIVDGIGTVDMALANVGVSASFIPTGIDPDYFDEFLTAGIGLEIAAAHEPDGIVLSLSQHARSLYSFPDTAVFKYVLSVISSVKSKVINATKTSFYLLFELSHKSFGRSLWNGHFSGTIPA